jgi:hypothetical protein
MITMLSLKILQFYKGLKLKVCLPDGVEYMNPYRNKKAFEVCASFYNKYYGDSNPRQLILGINPGRFGGGITGIPFTDPVKLETVCGIINEFPKKSELSADFVYALVDAFGGPEKFYAKFFISALSPLGFTKDGKNLNYYDIRELQDGIEPFMIDCLEKQLEFGLDRRRAYCLGEGTNFKYLQKLNSRFNFFDSIEALPHPRFIMQYKRKLLDEYVKMYVEKLGG